MTRHSPQVLLVDADDTLWENEAHFRCAFEAFLDRMVARGHERSTVAAATRRVETARCERHGYGSRNFAESLIETVRLLEGDVAEDVERDLIGIGRTVFEHEIRPFPEVQTTLESLATRHRLFLVTKGATDEQSGKLARSGLAPFFEHAEILREKTPAAYREILTRHDLPLPITWMIGNSPRSDINPAHAAGLRTVYVPHHALWALEDESFNAEPNIVVERFSGLLKHF